MTEQVQCLVQQGFTPFLARNVVDARSKDNLPLSIWVVDNSSSMATKDGRKLIPTDSQDDVRLVPCSRWEELQETVLYHAQLAALLDAPTKFVFLNPPTLSSTTIDSRSRLTSDRATTWCCPQELSIAERGPEWIQDDMEHFLDHFSSVQPQGVTPLTSHLRNIYQSLLHMERKIVLVLATDGKPTDDFGYSSPMVDRDFENALSQVQSKAWIVIRLCTDDDNVLQYYQRLDDQLELSLEVLDDYLDEAQEVHSFNPWLTYSLSLHRCREMGMSCHPSFRFLDWLDERSLTRDEIIEVVRTLGLIHQWDEEKLLEGKETLSRTQNSSSSISNTTVVGHDPQAWKQFCVALNRQQKTMRSHQTQSQGDYLNAFSPWNPIKKRVTPWLDTRLLECHGATKSPLITSAVKWIATALVALLAILLQLERQSAPS
jgi:hypothetical protein